MNVNYNPSNETINVKIGNNDLKSNPSDPESFLIGNKAKD